MSDQHSPRESPPTRRPGGASPEDTPDSRARQRVKTLWQYGDLFHVTTRYPRRRPTRKVDRLAGILKNGLVAPGCCTDGSVRSDLHIVVEGCSLPYDRVVFLHRYGPPSYLYTLCEPGRFAVLIDSAFPVLTPEDLGPHWPILSQDEVYVRDRVAPEHLIGVAVHPADADAVLRELADEFRRLQIPLYDYDGTVLWPS